MPQRTLCSLPPVSAANRGLSPSIWYVAVVCFYGSWTGRDLPSFVLVCSG